MPVGEAVAGGEGHGRECLHEYNLHGRLFGSHGRNQPVLKKQKTQDKANMQRRETTLARHKPDTKTNKPLFVLTKCPP